MPRREGWPGGEGSSVRRSHRTPAIRPRSQSPTAEAGADEIVLLDITATHEGRGTLIDTVKRASRGLFVPFTVGGGIRALDDAGAVFDAGADKISINSAAVARPELIDEIGHCFGAQAVIVAIDGRRKKGSSDSIADAEVFTAGGRNPPACVWSNGRAKRKAVAQARFCSRPWMPTARATVSIASLPPR